METLVVLQSEKDVHAQQLGNNFSFLIPGFSGPGNDLRIVLTGAAQQELLKDMHKVQQAQLLEANGDTNHESRN